MNHNKKKSERWGETDWKQGKSVPAKVHGHLVKLFYFVLECVRVCYYPHRILGEM